MISIAVLAHQGGWDEVLFVTAPLVVFAGLLWMAKRRAEQLSDQAPPHPSEDDGSADGDVGSDRPQPTG